MNSPVVIQVRRGRDGKLYPAGWVLPEADRERAMALACTLVHRDRMSIRQAQETMLNGYAVRRSIGAIHRDLHRCGCRSTGAA